MKRWVWVSIAVVAGVASAAWLALPALGKAKAPIRIGLLHSLTGPMAISEKSMIDAEEMAIEEINARGGLLGRKVVAVKVDGRSDPKAFGAGAERLIADDKVSAIVGCWSSTCRKSVKPVVERADHLLIYPVSYEGMEQSPQIVYTGSASNQQVIPGVKWCVDVLKAKTFFLVGTDSVYPRAVGLIARDQLKALGASVAGEVYVGRGSGDVDATVDAIVKAKPDAILSTLEGDVNLPFYLALRGKAASKIPALTFTMTEDEMRDLPVAQMTHDYAVCGYFQSIDRPENHEFVRRFKAKYGADRVTCDAIAAAYNSVILWAQAVREAETADAPEARAALLRQSLNAPEGVISVDRESQQTWRPFFVGRVKADGQVEIVAQATKPIRPVPYPFSRTRDEWESALKTLSDGWGGEWAADSSRGRVSKTEDR